MNIINWGILSAANIAYEQVVPALRRSSRAKVTAIASRSLGRAARFNISTIYQTYEELLDDPNIDAVYIPLPNSLHKEWAVRAMKAGKHVLLEKPAVLKEEEMIEIIEVAKKNKVVFMEAFMYQFHSQHRKIKELLNQGAVGEYKHIKAHFSWMLEDPLDIRLNSDLGGGALWDVGCYGFHVVTQLIGLKPEKIFTTAKMDQEHNVDMTTSCFMIDKEGRTAEITVSMELPFIDRYEIVGTKGSITVDSAFRPDVSYDGRGKITVKDLKGNVIIYETIKSDQYLNQIEHFTDCVIYNEKPLYSAEDSLQLVRYLQKSYQTLNHNFGFSEA